MALNRNSANRFNTNIWPGFVDAMTGLLLVLMFVLTIFTVVQFVLRDTITGQASQLTELTAEVASLAAALGIEQDRSATLGATLEERDAEVGAQSALIANLTRERDAQAVALAEADSRITGFEAQVAGLLAQRAEARTVIAGLEDRQAELETNQTALEAEQENLLAEQARLMTVQEQLSADRARLMTEQEALNLALAQARDEIDAGSEAARLAAARREALEALVADLRLDAANSDVRIATLEENVAAALAEVSGLEAARQEDAAAFAVQLSVAEAARLAAERAADAQISDLEAARMADAAAAAALQARLQDADAELTAMTLALEEQRRDAEATLTLLAAAQAARDNLDMALAAALLARQQAENDLARALNEGDDLDARLLAALGLQENTAAELAAAREELAASVTAREDLAVRLAAALTAQEVTEGDLLASAAALTAALETQELSLAEIEARLAQAVLAQQAAQAAAAANASEAFENAQQRDVLERQLAAALLAQEGLEAEVAALSDTTTDTEQARAALEARLAEALAAGAAAQAVAAQQMTAREREAALLAAANAALSEEEALSAESLRQVELLNQQVAELRAQVGTLQTLLDISAQSDAEAQVQIEALGSQLNTALARVAAEERRRRILEESERARLQAEAERLAAEAQNLERYRSEFFGELRNLLAGQDGVQIVGDRFVFSSEVLFEPGRAELSALGEGEISNVAAILRSIAGDIPPTIDWVIRVDGHTDNVPLSGAGAYSNNWELSQARALSVVLYLIETEGIDPNRLAANGFGEYQPIATGDSPEARAANRRIELKLTER